MKTYVNPGKLRNCPECGSGWPQDPDHALRGCGWLSDLPRRVSPTNSDVLIHDGAGGRNRFLQLEIKGPNEPWPPAKGQHLTLVALAAQANWTVRILRGTTLHLAVHTVTSAGIETEGIRSHAEAVRRVVARWVAGALWRDAESSLATTEDDHSGHTHGWARVNGLWSCVQDYYAVGPRPDTACGVVLPSPGSSALTPKEVDWLA